MKKGKEVSALQIIGIIYAILGGFFVILGSIFMLVVSREEDAGMVGTVFAGIGGIFLIIGLVFLLIIHFKRKRIQRIIREGYFVWGTVCGISQNYSIQINHTHPYILKVQCRMPDGQVHVFSSGSIRQFIPAAAMGKMVKVYVSRDNYKYNYVDPEPILKEFVVHDSWMH